MKHQNQYRPFLFPGRMAQEATKPGFSLFCVYLCFHRIHRRQHVSEDDAGMSKHRLLPYNAYYHTWLTLNFTASDSSSDDRCSLKVLIVLQLTQLADSKFQLSITLFENAYFLTFSLNLSLNSLWSCPLLSPSSSWKNNSGLISYFLLISLKVSITSLLCCCTFLLIGKCVLLLC